MPDQHPPPNWLVDWAGRKQGKQGAIKFAILEQLGRMAYDGFPDDVIREQADEIEQWKPNTKIGAAYLRNLPQSVKPVPRNRRLPPSPLKAGDPPPGENRSPRTDDAAAKFGRRAA
jgi:hypothetical protein